jgi:hypothetical protein
MIKLVRYHSWHKVRHGYETAFRVALVKTGRKWLYVLALDATTSGGLKLWKVPLTDAKYMQPLMRGRKLYPMSRALAGFKRLAATHGISKSAKKLLKEARREQKAEKDNCGKGAASPAGDPS